jgi:hypothetical protein
LLVTTGMRDYLSHAAMMLAGHFGSTGMSQVESGIR